MRIAVCSPQVPFATGGAEFVAERLTDELRTLGHEADLVTVPFKWYPGARVLSQAFLWRLLDLEEVDGRPVDLVIATKFPSYVVRHPNKVVWLVHQFRQAYELRPVELVRLPELVHEPDDLVRVAHDVRGELRRDHEVDRPPVHFLEVEQPPQERLREHARAGVPLERDGDEVGLVPEGAQLVREPLRDELGAPGREGHLR